MNNDQLALKMLTCSKILKDLLTKISALEEDTQMPIEEKSKQIKNIKQELSKISSETDTIKRDIRLLSDYNIN